MCGPLLFVKDGISCLVSIDLLDNDSHDDSSDSPAWSLSLSFSDNNVRRRLVPSVHVGGIEGNRDGHDAKQVGKLYWCSGKTVWFFWAGERLLRPTEYTD